MSLWFAGDHRIYLDLEVRRVDCRHCGEVKRDAVCVREEPRKYTCAGTKLATVKPEQPDPYTRIAKSRYSVSDGAASTHGLNTKTRAFSKSLVSRETIVKS
jgi:transposase